MLKKKKSEKARSEKARKKCVNERETVSYEQQILDNNRQLSRLRSRNEELENDVKSITKKYEQLKEDRSDVVAHLKRNLEEKIEEARELGERLAALEELRKQEHTEHKQKESALKLEYRTMKNALNAEVKLAAGKLNALEDWRLARLDLIHKFEIQEEQIAQQEQLHKTSLYETEKSVILIKAKMQREMEERLKQLAREFKEATNIRIADMMHNAVRRNIALNHELNMIIKVCQNLEIKRAECENNDRMLRLQCELHETEAKIALSDLMKQRNALHKLAREHIDTVLQYGQVKRENARLNNYMQLVNEYKAICVASEQKMKTLERRLDDAKRIKKDVLANVRKKCEEFNKLNKTLREARQRVLEALQLQEHVSMSDICVSCCAEQKQNIVHSLQDVLEQHSISDIENDDSQVDEIEF